MLQLGIKLNILPQCHKKQHICRHFAFWRALTLLDIYESNIYATNLQWSGEATLQSTVLQHLLDQSLCGTHSVSFVARVHMPFNKVFVSIVPCRQYSWVLNVVDTHCTCFPTVHANYCMRLQLYYNCTSPFNALSSCPPTSPRTYAWSRKTWASADDGALYLREIPTKCDGEMEKISPASC